MGLPNILLVGGGHAQLAVLADWIRHGRPGCTACLVSPRRHLRYSGMVPGIISGDYEPDEGLIDLAALAARARVQFIEEALVALDAEKRRATLADGRVLEFSICSLDTGGVGQAAALLGPDPRLRDIRPIEGFMAWQAAKLRSQPAERTRIAVIGGGAGGVELAFALRNAKGSARSLDVRLITGDPGLLPDHGRRARALAAAELERQAIAVDACDARIIAGRLHAGETLREPVDHIVAAIGSGAPPWLGSSGLALDAEGFVMVDRYQRSLSHPHVLAAGDVAVRQDRPVAHAGVHAVRAGPVLAANLRSMIGSREPRSSYSPRRASLYLLSTGNRSAILVYGRVSLRGRWVWHLKRWIDKRWVQGYARLAGKV